MGMSIAKPRRQSEDPDRRTEANWRAHFRQGSSSTQTIDVPRVRLGSQIVSMMQPAESWHGYNSATCRRVHFRLTTLRRSLRQRQVRSIFVVIPNTLVRQTFQVTLIDYDYVIEQIPATVANPTLSNTVLPRTSEAGPFRLDAQRLDGTDDLLIEARSPIKEKIRYFGEESQGNASLSCCMVQVLFGCLVTLQCRMRRRSCAMTKKQYSTPNVRVGTVKRSIAAIASR